MFKKTIKDGFNEDVKNVKEIILPEKNKTKIILKNRNFSGYEAVLNIKRKENIKSIVILTYWISIKTSKKAHMICEDIKIIAANNLKMASRAGFEYYNDKNLKLTDIHSKVQLVKTEKNYYIISSSANFGTVDNLDFTVIQNNKKLYIKLWEVAKEI